jgi:hypothetical protein
VGYKFLTTGKSCSSNRQDWKYQMIAKTDGHFIAKQWSKRPSSQLSSVINKTRSGSYKVIASEHLKNIYEKRNQSIAFCVIEHTKANCL